MAGARFRPPLVYTYAVTFTADEVAQNNASGLRFSHPSRSTRKNFLGLSVGQLVPVGYYDADAGHWVPGPNGVVVKVLNIGAGQASLDVDGQGNPATSQELSALGHLDRRASAARH